MAAVLKKRVIAELTQTIQEEAKPPPKKLRLIHKVKVKDPELNLQDVSSSHDALQLLLQFEENLPVSTDYLSHAIQVLMDHYQKDKEPYVRAKIASLLGELAKTPGFNATVLVSDIKKMLQAEKSHKVISQLLASLTCIGLSLPQDTKLHQQLIEISKQHLKDSSHVVRDKCLQLIGSLGMPGQTEGESTLSSSDGLRHLQAITLRHTEDRDPRVRTSAFEAMLSWHQRGISLEQSIYGKACEAMSDDFEGVRVASLKLIWVLSHLYPESMLKVAELEEELRLVDDGFGKICHLVNDNNMKVRAEALRLLGSLHQVSPHFLEQTLDKKLMSNMRRKTTAHERNREHFEKGEWATGSKWADDKPKEELDADSVNVISSGACGAFVHGLEDEYLEVRNAAIDAICELATQSPPFANHVQDFLIDMFNDEIEAVRLNAINSICKIAHHIVLRDDHLDIILAELKDYNFEVREALREMFCVTRLGTRSTLRSCVLGLLDNLKRYPQDRASVWSCMRMLGLHHPALTLPIVPELLSVHPYFDSPEPNMDDPIYISVLVLVFNAATDCVTMPQLFPEHILRHYTYLRDTLPDLVPRLKLAGVPPVEEQVTGSQDTVVSTFLSQTLDRLSNVSRLQTKPAQELMNMAIRDLGRVSEVGASLSASAEFTSLYIQCQLCLAKLLSSSGTCLGYASPPRVASDTGTLLDRIFHHSHQMEQLFVGLSLLDIAAVRQIRLRAQTLALLNQLRTTLSENKRACAAFLQIVNQLQKYLTNNNLEADTFTSSVLAHIHQLESCDPNIFLSVLQDALTNHKPGVLKLTNQLCRGIVEITEPTGTSDNAIKFTAGLTAACPLIANVDNVPNVQNLRIQIKYPDQQVQWVIPKPSDLRQLGPLHHKLHTDVILSHGPWSEVCHVEMSVVLCYDPDADLHSNLTDTSSRMEASASNVLELSKVIKVLVSPKPTRK